MTAEHGAHFTEVLLLLGAAVLAAPLAKRVGLATVLGYLAAGVAIGPVADLVTDGADLLPVAELGVVFLLFVIGLELNPSRLWAMRRDIFGMGLAQVVVTGAALTAICLVFAPLSWQAAIIVGFALALSSTAFALQLLEERGDTNRSYGRSAFSILLFQDLAIVPLLALVPLLAPGAVEEDEFGLAEFVIAVGAIALLLVAGRYLLNPLFRVIANTGAKEAMIATALFIVLGAAALMQLAGLSMAMGAFIAGVMLAESSYRHELEADIEPFRGILVALFFMAVGLSLDLDVILDRWLAIVLAVPVLMAVKAICAFAVARAFGVTRNDAVRIALLLPQGGEFGFVVFTAAAAAAAFSGETASLLIAVVSISMAMTPIAATLERFLLADEPEELIDEDFDGAGADVLLIGFSRFGQMASQVLLSGGVDVTIIDHSANQVRAVEKFGFRIYFGDGRRKDVLEAAGIRKARLVAVCTNGRAATDHIVDLVQSEFPQVRLFVRAHDREHTLSLRARGVAYEIRETVESAFAFGRGALQALGATEDAALAVVEDVRRRDEERLAIQAVDGFHAGADRMHTRKLTPEPLVPPTRQARRLDRVAAGDETAAGAAGTRE